MRERTSFWLAYRKTVISPMHISFASAIQTLGLVRHAAAVHSVVSARPGGCKIRSATNQLGLFPPRTAIDQYKVGILGSDREAGAGRYHLINFLLYGSKAPGCAA